jgi:hypothetical protein
MKTVYFLPILSIISYISILQSAERIFAQEKAPESWSVRSFKDRTIASASPSIPEPIEAAQLESSKIGQTETARAVSTPEQNPGSTNLLAGLATTSIASNADISSNGSSISLPTSSTNTAGDSPINRTNTNNIIAVKREGPRERLTKTISSALENVASTITNKVRSISWPASAEDARNTALARVQEAEKRAIDVLNTSHSQPATTVNVPTAVGVALKITGVTTKAKQVGNLLEQAYEYKNNKNDVKLILDEAEFALKHIEELSQQALKTAQAYTGSDDPSNPAIDAAQKSSDAVQALKTALQLTQHELLPK